MVEMILYNGNQYYDGGTLLLKTGTRVQVLLDNNFKKIFVGIKENNDKKEFFELEKDINNYLDSISNSDIIYEGNTKKIFSIFGSVVVFSTIFFGSSLVIKTNSPYNFKTIAYAEEMSPDNKTTNLDYINLENMNEKNKKIVMEYLDYITNEYAKRGITLPYIDLVEKLQIHELTADEFKEETKKAIGFVTKSNFNIYLPNTISIDELFEEKLKYYGMTSEEYYKLILQHEIFHVITNCGFTGNGKALAEAINEKENYNFYGNEKNKDTYKSYQMILEILCKMIPYDEIVQDLFNDDVGSLYERMSLIYGNSLTAVKLFSMMDRDYDISYSDKEDKNVELNELDLDIVEEIVKYEKAFIIKKMEEDKNYTLDSLNADILYFQSKNSEIFDFDDEYTKRIEEVNTTLEDELYANYTNVSPMVKSDAISLLYGEYSSKVFTDKKYGMSLMINMLTNQGEEVKDIFSLDYNSIIQEFNKIGIPSNDVMKFLGFLDLYYNSNMPEAKQREYSTKILDMLIEFERKSFSYKIENVYTSDFGLEVYLGEMSSIKILNTILFNLDDKLLEVTYKNNLILQRDMDYMFCEKNNIDFEMFSDGEEYLNLEDDESIDIRR